MSFRIEVQAGCDRRVWGGVMSLMCSVQVPGHSKHGFRHWMFVGGGVLGRA